jgi:hypothetical protein
MHWSYADLLELPMDLYNELIAMLEDEAHNAPKH